MSDIIPLSFDSELFGYNVGKLDVVDYWDEHKFLKQAAGFSLVYLFSKETLSIYNQQIKLVDEKLIFKKTLERLGQVNGIKPYIEKTLTPKLLALAFQSGLYSRFKTDSRLISQEFERLYSKWVQEALNHDQILTDRELNGLITFSRDDSEASVGLFAVAEGQRGHGLGTDLIQATEQKAFQAGAKTLLIPTQATNIPACKLYEKLGYAVVDRSYVYHYISANK